MLDYITKFKSDIIFWFFSKVNLDSNNKDKIIKIKEYFEEAYQNFSKVLTSTKYILLNYSRKFFLK